MGTRAIAASYSCQAEVHCYIEDVIRVTRPVDSSFAHPSRFRAHPIETAVRSDTMLPPFIIDQIRRREEEERRRDNRPTIELPLPLPGVHSEQRTEDEGKRGVIIIDLGA